MTLVRLCLSLGCLLCLVNCGGGGGGSSSVAPVDNGLPFAGEGSTLDDLTGQAGEVTVVAHYLDYASGVPRIIVERATLSIDALQGDGPLVNIDPDMTITLNGETLTFVDGTAVDSTGKTWSAYIDTTGTVSGTAGVYHYDYGVGAGAFDIEGVFAFGLLTDPRELLARNDTATYSGNWFGYGLVTDGAGGIVQNEAIGGGSLSLDADFAAGSISGSLTGSYDSFGRVDGDIETASWSANSFATVFDRTCAADASCTSDTVVGGAFFGVDGVEISGAIGFDEWETDRGVTRRLTSSAGYTLTDISSE